MFNMDDYRKKMEDEMQESIYNSALAVHRMVIKKDFNEMIEDHIERRINLIGDFHMFPGNNFYKEIKYEIRDLFDECVSEFIRNKEKRNANV